MQPPTLTTERLVLRPLEPGDAEAVHRACQDADILRWTTVPNPYRLKHAEEFVGVISPAGWSGDTLYNFGVFTADGTFVGSMGLVDLTRLAAPERRAELGFWTDPRQRGHGYTTEAARAVARWSFRELGVERLEWLAEVGNEASRAVARSVGFVMEGTQRARMVNAGVRRDVWVAALLPQDLGIPTRTPYRPGD
ncbi:GNAT family N-acetyltransferase [Streptomyces sp. XM4193]|uniref:GNAT family N-acetyltransferase n=1 Tax=Streptomyces sp. XM4193 TaxID=2929782 RepID=UPI001FFA3206|nr:GNAT family N-acetyltransferase [Streptomyces sp. XM4193]MCK1799157.1 GNAT family N-acetyltransferase [Streptomyces sp. XM4193]